jgi:hypothetical protein
MRVKVYDPMGKAEGELLYLYTYPRAVRGLGGFVGSWVATPQRCGIRLDDGRTMHWTCNFHVSSETGSGVVPTR